MWMGNKLLILRDDVNTHHLTSLSESTPDEYNYAYIDIYVRSCNLEQWLQKL